MAKITDWDGTVLHFLSAATLTGMLDDTTTTMRYHRVQGNQTDPAHLKSQPRWSMDQAGPARASHHASPSADVPVVRRCQHRPQSAEGSSYVRRYQVGAGSHFAGVQVPGRKETRRSPVLRSPLPRDARLCVIGANWRRAGGMSRACARRSG